MRINQRQIKRRQVQILIRNSQEDSPIHRRIALIHFIRRLPTPPLIPPRNFQRRIRQIQLAHPSHELGLPSTRTSNIAIIRTDSQTGLVPGEEDFAAGEGERLGAVAGDAGAAVFADFGAIDTRFGFRDGGVAGVGLAGSDDFVFLCGVGGDSGGCGG